MHKVINQVTNSKCSETLTKGSFWEQWICILSWKKVLYEGNLHYDIDLGLLQLNTK
jgi:hypothetical protein